MKMLEMTQATAPLADYARNIKEPVILTVNGKPIAALVSIENVDWETLTLSTHPQFMTLIEHSRSRQQDEGGISSHELRRRLGVDKKTRGE